MIRRWLLVYDHLEQYNDYFKYMNILIYMKRGAPIGIACMLNQSINQYGLYVCFFIRDHARNGLYHNNIFIFCWPFIQITSWEKQMRCNPVKKPSMQPLQAMIQPGLWNRQLRSNVPHYSRPTLGTHLQSSHRPLWDVPYSLTLI